MEIDALRTRILAWVKQAQTADGGICAFGPGTQVYPEVTGYMIPTFLAHGETDAAFAAAEALLMMQQDDGSFLGIDGVKRTFDTAACVEGLIAADKAAVTNSEDEFYSDKFRVSAWRALDWLGKMKLPDGRLRIHPDTDETQFYTIRASGLMNDKTAIRKWTNFELPSYYRLHYLMYAAEGFHMMRKLPQVERLMGEAERRIRPDGLLAFDVRNGAPSSSDLCATAQMGVLYAKLGHVANALGMLEAIAPWVRADGSMPIMAGTEGAFSWAAKFTLDLIKAVE